MSYYSRVDMCEASETYVVNAKYREVLRLRYCEGQTYEKIGEICNYSTQHVKHICKIYRDYLMSQV